MTIKIDADTSSGLQLESDTSGIIDIQSAGTTKMTIGTTIDIQGNELVLDADADTSIHADTDDQIDFKTGGTDRMKIDASGNTTILGTDSTLISGEGTGDRDFSTNTFSTIDIPSYSLMNQVTASAKNISGLGMDFTNGILGIVNNYQYTGGGKIAFYTGDKTSTTGNLTEAMRILSGGKICFGSTTAESTSEDNMQIDPSGGNIYMYQNSTALQGVIDFRNPNGYIGSIRTTGSSTQFNTSSDYRLKENIDYTFDATTELKRLKPCKFNFKADTDTTVEGFIAHEVAEVVPHAISGEKDATDDEDNPIYQQIDQSKLVPLLVKTIQELEARITALESE